MKTITTLLYVAFSLTTALGQEALRQRSNTRGLNLGVHGQYMFWGTTDSDYKDLFVKTNGPGASLRIGYGFSHGIEAFVQIDGSYLTTSNPDINESYGITLANLEIGGRLNIGSTTSRLRPFFDLGYSRVGASANPVVYDNGTGTASMYGGGLLIGGGLNYFLSIPFAITLRGSTVIGRFNSIDFEGDPITSFGKPDIGIARASLGLTWYLRGRR